jgi:hypothetical protein
VMEHLSRMLRKVNSAKCNNVGEKVFRGGVESTTSVVV